MRNSRFTIPAMVFLAVLVATLIFEAWKRMGGMW